MFRTADGAGVSKIFLTGITPTPHDRFGAYRAQLAKVALGAEQAVPWEYIRSLTLVLKKLRRDGYTIFALEQSKRSVRYDNVPKKFSRAKKLALIVGNGVRGVPPSVLRIADAVLEIPMRGAMVRQTHHPKHMQHGKPLDIARGKESLNVSVAFGIAAYEMAKD